MNKTLIVTVGGSSAPILTAIQQTRPERVIYICSTKSEQQAQGSDAMVTGKGTPCKIGFGDTMETRPNIPTQLGEIGFDIPFNPSTDLVLLPHADRFVDCYQIIQNAITQLVRAEAPGEIIADYTGGTKTMSAALVAVALDMDIQLSVTTGKRVDLTKVTSQQRRRYAPTDSLKVSRTLHQSTKYLEQFNYPAITTLLEPLLELNLSLDEECAVQEMLDIASALNYWDKFDHLSAIRILNSRMSNPLLRPFILQLKRTITAIYGHDNPALSSEWITHCHGYEVVEDMLLNAERRLINKQYDDAVARLYRTVELLAQTRLKLVYQQETGNIDSQQLPAALQMKYEPLRSEVSQRIQLPLMKSYQLLIELDDLFGNTIAASLSELEQLLRQRNYSILAHGMEPVQQEHCLALYQKAKEMIELLFNLDASIKKKAPASQFPQSFKY